MFILTAAKNRLTVEQKELLTSGSSEVNYCRISFDTAWDGMTREVVFRAGGRSIVAEERDGLYVIPWEVLEAPMQTLYVGVRGMKGDTVVLPTVWANLGYITQGTPHGTNAIPPTPDLVTQALTRVDTARLEAQSAANQAQADADRAAALAEEAANKAAQTARDAESASKAQEAAMEAQRLAETAKAAAQAAQTAAQAAQDAAAQSSTDAEAAKTGAETARQTAQDAAAAAAQALTDLQALYREMQDWADGVIQDAQFAANSAGASAQAAAESADVAKNAQKKAEEAAVSPPMIRDGTWWVYDQSAQEYVDTSMPARGEPGPAGKSSYIAVTLTASGWDAEAKTQTVQAAGVLSDETKQLIIPSPAQASMTSYYGAGILCTGQAEESLTFTAHTVPTEDIAVYVTLQEVTA